MYEEVLGWVKQQGVTMVTYLQQMYEEVLGWVKQQGVTMVTYLQQMYEEVLGWVKQQTLAPFFTMYEYSSPSNFLTMKLWAETLKICSKILELDQNSGIYVVMINFISLK